MKILIRNDTPKRLLFQAPLIPTFPVSWPDERARERGLAGHDTSGREPLQSVNLSAGWYKV
jgi:hypothetical protein